MSGLDFLVIGAQKAGTTTLWHLLRQHPELELPAAKEAPFFADDRLYALGMAQYEADFFSSRRRGALRGSVSPQYMLDSVNVTVSEIASRIARELPEVKLISILRDPVERAISHHRMTVRRGYERRPVAQALRDQLSPGVLAAARRPVRESVPLVAVPRVYANSHYLVAGEYGRILTAYRRHFERGQLLTVLTSELEANPEAVLSTILEFLGVQASWRPVDPDVHRLVGGDRTRVSPEALSGLDRLLTAAVPDAPVGVFNVALEEWNTLADPPPGPLPGDLERRLRGHFARDARLLLDDWDVTVPWAADATTAADSPAAATGHPSSGDPVAEAIAVALDSDTGLALIRRESSEAVRLDEATSTAAEGLSLPPGVAGELLGVDPVTGRQVGSPPLGRILQGRHVAAVCPAAILPWVSRQAQARSVRDAQGQARREELDVRVAVPLDDVDEIDRALMSLGAQREAYDAVVILGEQAGKLACVRIARELRVVALALGPPLARFLYPGYDQQSALLARAQWEVAGYIRSLTVPEPEPLHALEGKLLRTPGNAIYYIERGSARPVEHPGLLILFDHEPVEVEPEVIAELPRGAPLAIVHERLTGPFVLLDGHRRAVDLGTTLIHLDDFALRALPATGAALPWRPTAE